MTIFLKLFLTFFEIGAVSFGGGYAMIAMIRDKALLHGWLSEAELLNMIAIAESTPGPIAVNMATFVGSSEGGFLGAICATIGVILPSFLIILLIAALIRGFLKLKLVRAALSGIRPCTVGLILATAITMLLSGILGLLECCAILAVAVLVAGLCIGTGAIIAVQRKYNKGVF